MGCKWLFKFSMDPSSSPVVVVCTSSWAASPPACALLYTKNFRLVFYINNACYGKMKNARGNRRTSSYKYPWPHQLTDKRLLTSFLTSISRLAISTYLMLSMTLTRMLLSFTGQSVGQSYCSCVKLNLNRVNSSLWLAYRSWDWTVGHNVLVPPGGDHRDKDTRQQAVHAEHYKYWITFGP